MTLFMIKEISRISSKLFLIIQFYSSKISSKQNQLFHFNFDSVFDETFSSESIYLETVRPLLKNLLNGQSSCILMFGPTNSGKSHSLKCTTTQLDSGLM